jgi:acylphosphatase
MSSEIEITTLRLTIEGSVQAVGYRNFLIAEASQLGLDGWVRNRANGDVEVLVSGENGAVEHFIATCARGPAGSQVKGISMEKAEPPSQKGFGRRPSI